MGASLSGYIWPLPPSHPAKRACFFSITVVGRLSEAKLMVNLAKCSFAQTNITYLGQVVGNGEVLPLTSKVQAICDYPVPTTKKGACAFF